MILREQPCLLLQPGLKNTKYFDDAFHGYEKMDNDQKDMFFDLANCYDGQIEVLTSYLKENPKLYSEDIAQKAHCYFTILNHREKGPVKFCHSA